ncbi:BrnT family toxin [Chromatocurvus halotolerans]|uniref:BrnT family toxin n=1 Tax=Chromatocurvus halotolerans TaxID=1132028 RepID=UPI00196B6ACD
MPGWLYVRCNKTVRAVGGYTATSLNVGSTSSTPLIADPNHSDEEDRFILLGTSIHSRLLVVCHCVRSGETIPIVSARRADKRERKVYEGYRHA